MTSLLKTLCLCAVTCTLGLSLHAEYKGNAGKGDMDANPLGKLSAKQHKHYKAYEELNNIIRENTGFNQKKACEDTFADTIEWCQDAIKKYQFESMKAGDKAKEAATPDKKKAFLYQSALYARFAKSCEMIIAAYNQGQVSRVQRALKDYRLLEEEARKNAFQYLKREWLTYPEFERLFILANRSKLQKGREANPQNTLPHPAPEPKQKQKNTTKKR